MNQTPDTNTIDLIMKLRNKGQETDNAAERELFLGKASRLAAKHSVTEAMMDAAKPADRELPGKSIIPVPSTYSKEHCGLVCSIAKGLGARAIMHRDPYRSRGYGSVTVIGFQADRDATAALYNVLQHTLASEFKKSGSKSYKLNLAMSFNLTVYRRLVSEMHEAKAQKASESHTDAPGATGVSMVMADRTEKVKNEFRTQFPNTQKVGTKTSNNFSGSSRGRSVGNSANLNTRGTIAS
jgi:hypothetical protein